MTMDQTLTRLEDMADAGLVDAQDLAHLADIADRYAIAMTDTMRAQVSGPVVTDPIARQFVPTSNEAVTRDHERTDPIGDDAHSPVPGIVHRYPDRVLLKPVTVCPVYCRFCFRRAVVGPGESAVLPARDLEHALEYIALFDFITDLNIMYRLYHSNFTGWTMMIFGSMFAPFLVSTIQMTQFLQDRVLRRD